MNVDITVAVVSYNTRDLLRQCLRSLEARQAEGEAALEIVVADNASADGSAAMVRAEFPGVRVLEMGENAGFGRANNAALNGAQGRAVCLINSDAEVLPGALRDALALLDAHTDVGLVGGQLLWPDGRTQTSYGDDPKLAGVFQEQTLLGPLLARLCLPARLCLRLGRRAAFPATRNGLQDKHLPDVDQICGAFMLIRRDAWQQIGGFDPHYFMYNEDVDLNFRLRDAGWRVVFVPRIRITHHLGASSRADWQTRARMVSAYNASRFYYFGRHGGPSAARRLRFYCLLGAALRLSAWTLLLPVKPQARDKVRLFWEVWRQTWRMTDAQ